MLTSTRAGLTLLAAGAAIACGATTASSAPIPGAMAEADHLVGGPTLLSSGKIAWVEATDKRWRLRLLYGSDQPGTPPTTLASGPLAHEEDEDSGEVVEQTIGGVWIAGGDAVIEFRERSGSRKYSQYSDRSTVERYGLSLGHSAASPMAECSRHVDEFGGPNPNAEPSPAASVTTDGETTVVSLCGTSKVFSSSSSTPLATLPATYARVTAAAGDYVAAAGYEAGARYFGVWNWRTNTELYRMTGLSIQGHTSSFALEPSGTVSVVTHAGLSPEGCRGQLTRHTPSAPGGTLLADDVCPVPPSASSAEVAVETEPVPGAGRRLTVVRADGTRQAAAWLGAAPAQPGPFGLYEGRVVYAVRGCDAWTIALANGDATPRGLLCPDVDVRRARRTGRTLRVRVRLAERATAPVTVTYRAGGRTFRTQRTPAAGRIDTKITLPRWAQRRAGTTTVTYPGDATFRRQAAGG